MKNIYFALILLAVASSTTLAQDKIYYRNGLTLIGKVIDVNRSFVKYIPMANPNGKFKRLPIPWVDSIKYESGEVEVYKSIKKEKFRRDVVKVHYPNNLTSSGLGIVGKIFSWGGDAKNRPIVSYFINYERFFANDNFSISISPFIGLNKEAYGFETSLKVFPRPIHSVRFGIGPKYIFSSQDLNADYYIEKTGFVIRKYKTSLSHLGIETGLYIPLNPKLVIISNFYIGGIIGNTNASKNIPADWSIRSSETPHVGAKLSLGYRF